MKFAFTALAVVLIGAAFWFGWKLHEAPAAIPVKSAVPASQAAKSNRDSGATKIFAHNLMLRKGPDFRIYVRWLRGDLGRTNRNKTPSFDDQDSFYLNIQDGVLRANIGDIEHYLNAGGLGNSPLKNVSLSGDGNQVTLKGTLHKVVPLPVAITGELSVLTNNQIKLHITKISVLKIPFKALLSVIHVTAADLAGPSANGIPGLQISGNDIIFDTQQLLPPPHIRGQLTTVHIVNPDLEEIYGSTQADLDKVEQWRNFLRLKGGSLDFGKLTMNQVDLIMVDISGDAWFDLDLAHYQKQLVNGYTRMTSDSALQIFMPDLSQIPDNATPNISLEWMKNRNGPVPASVTKR